MSSGRCFRARRSRRSRRLPLIESGAADRFGLSEAEIALACASHSGEDAHVAARRRCSAKPAPPRARSPAARIGRSAKRRRGRSRVPGPAPSALHNNCSGKHAGFICLACASGWDSRGYETPSHAVQREVKAAIEDLTGAALGADVCAIDGCSIPTYAIPLRALALGFARFATGAGAAAGAPARPPGAFAQAVAAHP